MTGERSKARRSREDPRSKEDSRFKAEEARKIREGTASGAEGLRKFAAGKRVGRECCFYMNFPRQIASIRIVAAVGLCSWASMMHGQSVTPAPAQTTIAVPPDKAVTASVVVTPTPGDTTDVTAINAKLDGIVIPEVKLENASLEDALAQIRTVVAKLDASTPADKMVNIHLDLTPKATTRVNSKVRLTMDLKAETLRNILGVIAKEAGLEMGVKPEGVTLVGTR